VRLRFCARIGAEDAQALGDEGQAGQGAAGGGRVAVAEEIQIERVFPGPADDGARLDLGQVDLALGEGFEGVEKRARLVGGAENDAGFERNFETCLSRKLARSGRDMTKKRVKFCGLLSMPAARICASVGADAAMRLAMAASSWRRFSMTIFTAPAVS
jgi:hypothetical protein